MPGSLTAERRDDYAKLLRYVADDGQVRGTSAGQLPDGYLALPPELREQALAAARALSSYVAADSFAERVTDSDGVREHRADIALGYRKHRRRRGRRRGHDGVDRSPAHARAEQPGACRADVQPVHHPGRATSTTPADPVSASRVAVLAALVLGSTALLARAVLPWVASRRT